MRASSRAVALAALASVAATLSNAQSAPRPHVPRAPSMLGGWRKRSTKSRYDAQKAKTRRKIAHASKRRNRRKAGAR